ncbi:MAG: hypothetical protein HYR84_08210 [Planctomycetes bacterium]|nr:hypothetical protein [Planctomycetota bacterium]
MPSKLTKAQARAFKKRWKLVNEREKEELRTTSIEVKWRQFNTLLRWAQAFDWSFELAEAAAVRERWMRLRKAYRDKKSEG